MGWKTSQVETFAGKVRAAARKLGAAGNEFSAADLSHAAGVQTFRGTKKLHWSIRDMKKAGELVSVSKGVYRLNSEPKNRRISNVEPQKVKGGKINPATQKREVMWRFLKMRKVVSVGDLQEAAGVSEKYAREWLRMLKRQEVVKKLAGGRWRLVVTDLVEAPHDIEKAEKLRRLRAEKQSRVLAALNDARIRMDQAAKLLDVARAEVMAMGE